MAGVRDSQHFSGSLSPQTDLIWATAFLCGKEFGQQSCNGYPFLDTICSSLPLLGFFIERQVKEQASGFSWIFIGEDDLCFCSKHL
jgi:hypothetical protein